MIYWYWLLIVVNKNPYNHGVDFDWILAYLFVNNRTWLRLEHECLCFTIWCFSCIKVSNITAEQICGLNHQSAVGPPDMISIYCFLGPNYHVWLLLSYDPHRIIYDHLISSTRSSEMNIAPVNGHQTIIFKT